MPACGLVAAPCRGPTVRRRRGRHAALRLLAIASAASLSALPASAEAPIEIGRSIFVVSDVEGRLADAPPKQIVVNDQVAYEEDITTGDEAKTVIEFRDGSTFEVGPGSVVRIDSFVFNPDEGVSRKALEVGRGVFRYVSGFAAPEQDTKISTSNGTLAIRGSVVAGIVDPDVPTFVYVGEGNAVFTNDAGNAAITPGTAIAVPSRTTAVMRPATMPPAVVAQALQAIERRLPPAGIVQRRPPADDAWLRRAGIANLVPIAEQARREAAVARGRPLVAPPGASRVAREVNLLVEGNRHNLFDGAQAARTPAQQAFIAQAERTMPQARATIARSTAQMAAMHRAANLAATGAVIRGVAAAAPSPEVLRRVTAGAARSNPAAAAIRSGAIAPRRGPEGARPAAPRGNTAARAPPRPRMPYAPPTAASRGNARTYSPYPPAPRQSAGRANVPQTAPGDARRPRPPAAVGPPVRAAVPPREAPSRERAASGPRRPTDNAPRPRRPEDQAPR